MIDERRQFRILYRDFLFRMVDLEALTAHGDIQRLLGQLAAILAALSFTLAVTFVPRYANSRLAHERLLIAAWGDEEFLIATTIAVVGLFAVIAWNAMLPDRRDSAVLGPLPVRTRTIFRAKITAIATALGISIVAVNIFTGLSFSFAIGGLRALVAYWVTMLDAGIFMFAALLAVQGIAAQLFSYRLFLRVAGFLQLAAFFVILSVYFLTPPLATMKALSDPANHTLLAWLPSFWFLGLFQVLNGSTYPAFIWLARHAMQNLTICVLLAGSTYALAYSRFVRRIIEQPDIAPGDRSSAFSRLGRFVAGRLCPRPLDRAILQFIARTLARSRQHRLLFAAYLGAGLAIAFAYAKSLVYGYSRAPWYQLNRPLLVAGLVVLMFAVIGARAVFALPQTLRANWIFRITAVHHPAMYFRAVRRSLYVLMTAPVWIVSALLYFAIWPGRPALEHLAVLVLAGMVVVDLFMYGFRKIPFACSYLPGGANINVKLGIYGVVFLLATEIGTQIEFSAMQRLAGFTVLFGVLLAGAIWARRRTLDEESAPENDIQFEELPPAEVFALDLGAQGGSLHQAAHIDALDRAAVRPAKARLKPYAIGALALLACGIAYEHFGEWRDRRRFPQIGRSVDIGGRSLNIFCSGEGSPAVIFDGDAGMPGLSWTFVQREAAKFTRACWYDRAGYGWSDPGPFPYPAEVVASDLKKLLEAAKIAPPYVLVGDAMGGLNVRAFNGLYRSQVAGMVLVDPVSEDLLDRVPENLSADWLERPKLALMEAAGEVGLIRLLAADPGPAPSHLAASEWAAISTLQWQRKSLIASLREGPLSTSAQQVKAAGGLENLPVIVLSGGRNASDEGERVKLELQTEIAQLSARGKLVVLRNAGRRIQFEAPEAIIGGIREAIGGAQLARVW